MTGELPQSMPHEHSVRDGPESPPSSVDHWAGVALSILEDCEPTPVRLLASAARAVVKGSTTLRGLVVHVVRTQEERRPRVLTAACSDGDLACDDPAALAIASDLGAAIEHATNTAHLRSDATSDEEWARCDERRRRASLGLHDYARAGAVWRSPGRTELIAIEIAGRTADWRPDRADAERALFTARVTAGAYEHRITRVAGAREDLLANLTPTQRDIARRLAQGVSESEIATLINRSAHTVHDHVKAVFRAWGVHSRAEALWLWRRPIDFPRELFRR